jgi:hypothetical protein
MTAKTYNEALAAKKLADGSTAMATADRILHGSPLALVAAPPSPAPPHSWNPYEHGGRPQRLKHTDTLRPC